MFQGLLRRAEQSVDSVVAKYVGRVLVAIPLLVAGGFATAALTTKLVELYGSVSGYSMMAALFAVISLITMAVVGNGATGQPADSSAASDTASVASETPDEKLDSGIDPSELLTPEVRAFLASSAPMALPSIARGIGRNLPLILILALIGFVISRFAANSEALSSATSDAATPSI